METGLKFFSIEKAGHEEILHIQMSFDKHGHYIVSVTEPRRDGLWHDLYRNEHLWLLPDALASYKRQVKKYKAEAEIWHETTYSSYENIANFIRKYPLIESLKRLRMVDDKGNFVSAAKWFHFATGDTYDVTEDGGYSTTEDPVNVIDVEIPEFFTTLHVEDQKLMDKYFREKHGKELRTYLNDNFKA